MPYIFSLYYRENLRLEELELSFLFSTITFFRIFQHMLTPSKMQNIEDIFELFYKYNVSKLFILWW